MHSEIRDNVSDVHLDIKCASCQRAIQASDWVRRAKKNVYHLACFACDVCKRQLSTGEEFALGENKILCKLHYIERLEMPPLTPGVNMHPQIAIPIPITTNGDMSPDPIIEDEAMWFRKVNRNKRVRTSFSEEQIQVLQANFEIDANPDSSELERIAADVGLPKRVTQVWFQNSRARQKKQQQVTQPLSNMSPGVMGMNMSSPSVLGNHHLNSQSMSAGNIMGSNSPSVLGSMHGSNSNMSSPTIMGSMQGSSPNNMLTRCMTCNQHPCSCTRSSSASDS